MGLPVLNGTRSQISCSVLCGCLRFLRRPSRDISVVELASSLVGEIRVQTLRYADKKELTVFRPANKNLPFTIPRETVRESDLE
jgi:hypothetical protein